MTSLAALFARSGHALSRHLSPTLWQAGLLFGVDMVTNLADYGFHVFLGRALAPGAFAIVQTVNALLLILVTTFAVLQPVVARYVAASGDDPAGRDRAIFQRYFWQSGILGLLLLLLIWLARQPLARWLNLPPTVVAVAALMVVLALVRPVVAGMLQGRQQFVAFGATRAAYALGRLLLALIFIGLLGGGALAGTAAMPLGATLALLVGLLLLGRRVWPRGPAVSRATVWEGWRLSLAALLAYAAYMGLLNVDLVWVNRAFTDQLAGPYAAAVVLRRVLAVLPGAVLVIFFPRVVTAVTTGRLPDRLLLKAGVVVVGANVALTALYFALAPWILRLTFGPGYSDAAPLLGWMGLGMIAYGVTAIWLNLYLATRPWPFVLLLAVALALQGLLLTGWSATLPQVTAVFVATGWLMAGGGLLLYVGRLRPALARQETNLPPVD